MLAYEKIEFAPVSRCRKLTIEYKVDRRLVGQSLCTTDDEQVPPVPLSKIQVKLFISCNAFLICALHKTILEPLHWSAYRYSSTQNLKTVTSRETLDHVHCAANFYKNFFLVCKLQFTR